MLRAAATALLAAAAALPRPAGADAIDDIVRSEMQRQHSPAVAIAVVRHGVPVKVRGYGIAHLEHRAPAGAATLFQTASIGKQFTAALVMLLVRDGRLGLDAPVSTWLPDAPAAWGGITVRHLLTHTAGLDRNDPAIDLQKDYTDAELLASAYRVPLKSAPGERFEYSNLGYQVLGFLVSRVGGRPWAGQMRDRLFTPLAMGARGISERDVIAGRAAGYERRPDGVLENQRWVSATANSTADGSLYVSARDMARWSVELDRPRVLDRAELQAMWQPARLAGGQVSDYGFGWALFDEAGHRMVRHRGDWQGYTTHIVHLPEDRLTVTVLMNRAYGQPHVLADRVVAHYLPALRRPAPVPPPPAVLAGQAMYLRGTINDWQPTIEFRPSAPGRLQARVTLAQGMHRFKIGDADWKLADFGGRFDEALVRPGRAQSLAFKGEDLFLEVTRPGEYTFELDLRPAAAPRLTVSGPPAAG